MAVNQLPSERDALAQYLRGLTALLDQDTGWYAVFRQRDPEGVRECLEGVEVPPWDVVEALLHDLAAARGAGIAAREEPRARRLHTSAAAAYDRRPGGREALAERVELMRQELIRSTLRAEELVRRRTAEPAGPAAARLDHELEWTRDDQARATARLAELRSRLTSLTTVPPPRPGESDSAPGEGWFGPGRERESGEPAPRAPRPADPHPADPRAPRPDLPHPRPFGPPPEPGPTAPAEAAPAEAASGRAHRRGLLRGARFAGAAHSGDTPDTATGGGPLPQPQAPAPPPRGARHGTAAAETAVPAAEAPAGPGHAADTAREVVRTLSRLRTAERGGEAHAVLCEAAVLPAAWLPVLAGELHRAGLDADWTTLLWEAASQPLPRVAAIAGALAAEGRESDGERLLRQGVARPVEEIARAALELADQGRLPEAHALLTACVQLHPAAEAARIAADAPQRLVPLLLKAARAQSRSHEHRLVHALRVAGHLAT
ncbi:hypothetical protein GCM10010387_28300 [Streptomyces inusitatus]|uniref:UL36 very large tegument protein n=1 Tax=Streptomyces inusitatus TaxID=68221 RepID=A0A918Q3R0_9ACTN|nr:hypothetical protein [Streptomyces inusitatus]GGZ32580.1 hypothetical protein GCM10010387_28300 [Streptomyces inusitatus]